MMYLRQDDRFIIPPSPIVVRAAPLKRMRRLRVAWFILGMIFGGAAAYCASSLIHADQYSRRHETHPAVYAAHINLAPPAQTPAPAPVSVAKVNAPAATKPDAPAIAQANPPQTKPALPTDVNVSVHRGDTLMSMLMDRGIAYNEARNIVQSMKKVYNPKNLSVGQSLQLHLDQSKDNSARPSVSGLSIAVSPVKTIALDRSVDNKFKPREIKAEVSTSLTRGGGTINSSLYQTAIDSGIPAQMIGEIINALSYDIDFQRDIKEGDALDVVYERMHTDKGITTGYGKVIYASLMLGDKKLAIYNHVSPDGFSGYYNERGESVKKALLKTPINGAHITSGFGMRMHPLLGYSKMHKGVDFGAPVGTPIYAAGDGVIDEAGLKGTFGNYVRIKHSNRYETAYGHASRIARGIHAGVHVKQGQVIAYVGSTGRSTGPHLHYEILVNGEQVNPSGVKFRTGQTLQGRDLANFKRQVKDVNANLATLPRKTQVADLR